MADEQGRPSAALLQQPELPVYLERVWTAFWDLNGDRQLGYGNAGAIMWASIDAYARRYRITGNAFDHMQFLIRSMDNEYQRLMQARQKKDGLPQSYS